MTDRTRGGWTLLHQATILNAPEVLELLLSYSDDRQKLSWVNDKDSWNPWCGKVDRSTFSPWLSTSPHRNVRDATALHYACMTGDVSSMRILIRSGAKVDVECSQGLIPQDYITDDSHEVFKEFRRMVNKDAEGGHGFSLGDVSDKDKGETVAKSTYACGSGCPFFVLYFWLSLTLIHHLVAESMEEFISKRLVGQKGPVHSVSAAIRMRDHGWTNPDRPLVMLFLGSSGVGKTEIAKQIALYSSNKEAIASDAEMRSIAQVEAANGFIRIDMSEYQHSHHDSNLFGAFFCVSGYYFSSVF